MPFQIAHQDEARGHAAELAQQRHNPIVGEMVQEQRAVHQVHGAVTKGQVKRIAAHTQSLALAHMEEITIDGNCSGGRIVRPHQHGSVSGSRTDVHERKGFRSAYQFRQHPQQDRVAAKAAINTHQIAKTLGRFRFGRIVKELGTNGAASEIWHDPHDKMPIPGGAARCCHAASLRMDIVSGNLGWIEVVCGPMFSGKTEELMRRLRRARIARKRVQVFKPAIDDRYSGDEIVSHNAVRMKSIVVSTVPDILAALDWRTEVVGIDEAHFFGAPLVELTGRLADSGKQVIVAGLDTDYLGRPFPPVPELLALAESITKTLAICMRCGNPAKHTQRLIESDDLIVVGAAGAYEARCRRCFEPGVPRQESLEFARPTVTNR